MDIESAREIHFFKKYHRHFFTLTDTSQQKFTGKGVRSRALYWTFSWALLSVNGQRNHKCLRAFIGSRAIFDCFHFFMFTGIIVWKLQENVAHKKSMFFNFEFKSTILVPDTTKVISNFTNQSLEKYKIKPDTQNKWLPRCRCIKNWA